MSNSMAVKNPAQGNRNNPTTAAHSHAEDALVLPVSLRIIVTAAVMLATIMEVLDTTIVNVALPDMMGNLGATLDQIGWVATGYIVANVIILPLTGWLSDYFGRKKYLAYSILFFTAASFGCGISHSLGEIIIWRILQGAGGAAFISTAQATLMEIYPKRQHGLAQAIYGVGVIMAPTFGPVVGGILTDRYSWPWVFFINIPVGITALLLTLAFVPDSAASRGRRKADFVGIGLLAVGLGCVQTVLEQGERYGWMGDPRMRNLSIIATLALGVFLWWELRPANEHPAVNLRVLKFRNLAVASIYMFSFGFMLYGFVFILPQFLQTVQNFTAEQSGFILLPSGLAAACMMPIVGQLSNRVDKRWLIGVGMIFLITALIMFFHLLAPQTPADSFLLPLIFRGAGTGLQFVPLSLLALGTLPPQYLGDAAGIYNLFRMLGGSFGIAFIVTLVDRREHFHYARMVEHFSPYSPHVQQFVEKMQHGFVLRGMPGNKAAQVPYAFLSQMAHQQATIQTYLDIFYVISAVAIGTFFLLFFFEKVEGKNIAPPAH
jgi:DHA2 family multidrug resistance protein